MKKNKKTYFESSTWFYLTAFWSIIFIGLVVYDFIKDNALGYFIDYLSFIYIGLLTIYVGNKEFERWYKTHKGRHPGEWFVIIWTIVIFSITIIDIIQDKAYKMPSALISSYIAVLTILAITEKSKEIYRKK